MIQASDVFKKIRRKLDDDDSGRYDANDLVPAVNAAIDFWVRVFNAGFEAKRIFHESLSDLINTKVYTADVKGQTGYVNITADRLDIWTVFGVDPNPDIEANELEESKHKWATRMSLTEWNDSAEDPFAPGNLIDIPDTFGRPAYIGIGKYLGDGDYYIAIRPASFLGTNNKVAIWYLKNPDKVDDGYSEIELPANMINLVTNKAVQWISHQHGGQSPYFEYSEHDINQAIQILSG